MEPSENTMSDHFPAGIFELVTKRVDPFVNFFRRLVTDISGGGIPFQLRALVFWLTIAFIFMVACLHVKMKNKDKFKSQKVNDDEFINADAKFAEELQVQEFLLDQFFASRVRSSDASSSVQRSDTMNSKLVKPPTFCEICLENKESWQMFVNDSCSHAFCYICTSNYIVAKIEENLKTVSCPAVNCNAVLDINVCRWMIPLEAVVKWDESLCKSLIPDSQKLYCPYNDCSTLLVDDSGNVVRKIKCPICKRSFCARCRVPWHPEFTCKEFRVLNAEKGKKDERMVKSLAKKKNWQKCPNCKVYVDKTEGCSHMVCRCGHEFCYKCGGDWNGCKAGCLKTRIVP